MKKTRNYGYILIPIVLAVGTVGGIFIGMLMGNRNLSPTQEKWATLLSLIDQEYVDKINVDSLLEKNIPELLAHLDPHSAYIPASELIVANEELDNSFSGVGISFQLLNDTVTVVEVIAGGPAERAGLQPGDRILSSNGKDLTGSELTNDMVFKNLRGPKGTKVNLKVRRQTAKEPLSFDIVRDDIPVNSVDAVYMASPEVGYLRVSKFGNGTYDEFFNALTELQSEGARKFVIDLRGNSGDLYGK